MLDFDENRELNIPPLVDVMLLLLAILRLPPPPFVYQEKIELPKGSKSSQMTKTEKISVRIDLQKNIYVNEKKYDSITFADTFPNHYASLDKESQITIRADKNLKYDDVMFVMKVIKTAGFQKISLVTDG